MLWVGRFSLVDGEAREDAPWLGIYPDPSASEADPVDLYLVVEPALPGSEEYCADLSAAIGSVFHQGRLSLTGGLLRALNAAHENLRDWNRKSLKEHRVAAGVSCLALRAAEAYLAQVAPACAFLLHDGTLRQLQPRLPDAREPLGLHEEFRPDFSRHQLAEGDRLLLATASLAQALPPAEWLALLQQPPPQVLPVIYRRLHPPQGRELLNCGALLLALLPDSPA